MSLASHGNSDFLVSDSFMYFPSCQVRVSILTHIFVYRCCFQRSMCLDTVTFQIYIYIYIAKQNNHKNHTNHSNNNMSLPV